MFQVQLASKMACLGLKEAVTRAINAGIVGTCCGYDGTVGTCCDVRRDGLSNLT